MRNKNIFKLTAAALLVAIGIVIPMFSPVKIPLGPWGSFTLASHVAIFIAVFIAPEVAVAVTIGTTLGFFLGSFPLPIVLRAASHIVFAVAGAFWLRKKTITEYSVLRLLLFSFIMALIHAAAEVIVITVMFFSGDIVDSGGYFVTVIVMVGFVTVVHSIVDFAIAYAVARPLKSTIDRFR